MQKVLNVHIGEIKIARRGELLQAILGSCVGIAMIWKEKNVCGLAHCLLAKSPNPTFSIGGRFVDQAVASLIALMRIRKEDLSNIEVVVVGGGNMTNPGKLDSSDLVGSVNFRFALKELERHGLKVAYSDGEGEEGRKIFVDSANNTFHVHKIPRIAGAA